MTVAGKQKKFFSIFPTPEYLLLSTSGIALSDKAAKFIQFRRSSFTLRPKLVNWGKSVLPVGAIESGYIHNKEQVVTSLKEFSARYNLEFVRASLPDEKSYLFTAIIDKVPEDGLHDAVAFIIEENVPIALEKAVFDFKTIEVTDPAKLKVVVSVVQKEVIEVYNSVFEAAGMMVISFDVESQSIARAIMPKHDKRTTLIVSVGEKKVSFYVVEGGIVQFSTTTAQESLSTGSSLSTHDLKVEMRKVFSFWNSRVEAGNGGENKIERIIFSGSAINNHDLITDMSSEFPVEYHLAEAWGNDKMLVNSLKALPEPLEYVTAIGLAIQSE